MSRGQLYRRGRLRHLATEAGLFVARLLTEWIALGPAHGIVRRLLAARLAALAPGFDAAFYLAEIEPSGQRKRVERDPLLHYALFGYLRGLAPRADFDPAFYRAEHPDLAAMADPLLHASSRSSRTDGSPPPANETAALPALAASSTAAGTVVTLHHARGGGSSRFLQLYEADLAARGHRVARLARVSSSAPLFQLYDRTSGQVLGPPLHLFENAGDLRDALRRIDAVRLVVNHLIDLPPAAFTWVPAFARSADLPFDMILHDYYVICPRTNLVDGLGRYCGEPTVEQCRRCIRRDGSEVGEVEITDWRRDAGALLAAADHVIAPSADTARRIGRYWPELTIEIWQPESDAAPPPVIPRALRADEELRIAILGWSNIPKGFNVIRGLAHEAQRRRLPLRLVLVGNSIDNRALARRGIETLGRYREADVDGIIGRVAPHIAFFPAIWPETWSFVLSVALRNRLPSYAFDIGAIPDRLRAAGRLTILPLGLADRPDDLADTFLEVRRQMIDGRAAKDGATGLTRTTAAT